MNANPARKTLFWFRRDLRLTDNHGLLQAFQQSEAVLPIFIFDQKILQNFPNKSDARVTFIHQTLAQMKSELQKQGSDLWVFHGEVLPIFQQLVQKESVQQVFCNHDYEPSAIRRDAAVSLWLREKGVAFHSFKDQVIFEKSEVVKDDQAPYTVFTPYKKKWLATLALHKKAAQAFPPVRENWLSVKKNQSLLSLKDIGYIANGEVVLPENRIHPSLLKSYQKQRDFPALDQTSRLGMHLRFGTLSVRQAIEAARKHSETWLSELIWREFFMQIMFHFPHIETQSFRPIYDQIAWINDDQDFERWANGTTGFPLVDAGMRQLKQTGFMHNRVRMLTASFLTKHLLQHWSRGERHFAQYLLDYDFAANNGNWQWAAGSGCDAAPYFRVFNPDLQQKKFDPQSEYIRQWVPEIGTKKYPEPMIDHDLARKRAIIEYARVLKAHVKGIKK